MSLYKESWQRVFHKALVPQLSDSALAALRQGVAGDDPTLIQGATSTPPPLQCVQDWPVEAACLIGYCGWKGEGLTKVVDVEEYFAKACYAIDIALGEAAGVRYLLNWFDETPRPEMLRALLPEIDKALARREALRATQS